MKKRITSKGSQTCSQRRNTGKCHECPLKLEDIMTDYMTNSHLTLETIQHA